MKPVIAPSNNGRIGLVPLAREHLGLTWIWRNQDEVRRWFHHSEKIAWPDHLLWFERYMEKADDLVFIVVDLSRSGAPVGQLSLYYLNRTPRTAEYGRCVIGDPLSNGQGYLESASRLLMNISKVELGITAWTLSVKPDNLKAIHIYKKMGFEETVGEQGFLNMRVDFSAQQEK